MAVANFFTKSGVNVASVTEAGGIAPRGCDYIGNGQIVMARNSVTLSIYNLTPKLFELARSFTVARTTRGVSVQRDMRNAKDPAAYQANKAYIITIETV